MDHAVIFGDEAADVGFGFRLTDRDRVVAGMALVAGARVTAAPDCVADMLDPPLQRHIRHAGRQRYFLRAVDGAQIVRHVHGEVRRAKADIADPGLAILGLRGLGDKVDDLVGLIVRLVPAGVIGLAVIVIVDRRHILVPAVKADEVIPAEPPVWRHEPWLRSAFQMPLADIAGAVTGLLHQLREERLVPPQRKVVLHHAVALGVLAGHHRRPERTADWVGDIRLRKLHAFSRQPVDLRGFDHRVAGAAHGVVAHLIGIDHQEVRPFAHFSFPFCCLAAFHQG